VDCSHHRVNIDQVNRRREEEEWTLEKKDFFFIEHVLFFCYYSCLISYMDVQPCVWKKTQKAFCWLSIKTSIYILTDGIYLVKINIL
jgi:hypothetical protein